MELTLKRERYLNAINTRIVVGLLVMVIFTGAIFMVGAMTVNGEAEEKTKYYKSIMIEAGDTLWSIAEEYCDNDTLSITEYIEEIKEINNIKNEKIKSGNYLVISYFSE